MSKLRSNLYRAARVLGDVEAAAHGPGPYLRRRARKVAYRHAGGLLGHLCRSVRL